MTDIIASRIKTLREGRDWSQAELSRVSGVGQSYISRLEAGHAPNVAGVVLREIATALETTTDYLLGLTDDPDPRPPPDPAALADPRLRYIVEKWSHLSEASADAVYQGFKAYFKKPPEAHQAMTDTTREILGGEEGD